MTDLGTILEKHFVNASGKSYNLDLVAYDENGDQHVEHIVRMGGGRGDSVVSASYTVTLYKDQEFTNDSNNLDNADDAYAYPIPSANHDDNPVYNVVEVRIT